MYNIIISELATITTEIFLDFIKAFDHNYSLKIAENINKQIKNLNIFPHSHPIYKKTDKNIYRKLLINDVIHVIFTVADSNTIVLYVTDARKSADEYYTYLK